jgi:hypothetical protein
MALYCEQVVDVMVRNVLRHYSSPDGMLPIYSMQVRATFASPLSHRIASRTAPSNPVLSHPIPSHPIPPRPAPSHIR